MANTQDRQRWARLRFAIVGPLLASPPPTGQLHRALHELSGRDWIHPNTGLPIRFGISTIERWYYDARGQQDPVLALSRQRRHDAGSARVFSPSVVAQIHALYRLHPGWSVQLHHDNLRACAALEPALGATPSYSSLKRYFRANALVKKRKPRVDTAGARQSAARIEALEIRSYEAEYVHGLFHLDFHHGSRKVLEPDGRWIRPLLLGVIDDHSRLGCHLQWYRFEDTQSLVHGFCQALAKRGLPRCCMTDNGSAMISDEFTAGLHNLGIVHERTLPLSAYQNGKQENLWATLEGRLMAMIESSEQLTLDRLNLLTQVWLEYDYHRNLHSEIGTTPLRRFTEAPSVGRDAPDSQALRRAFRKHVVRRQRRSDGTCALEGKRFEIPSRFGHLESITLSYARWDLANVELIDPDTGVVLSRVYPLDKNANADASRRAREARHTPTKSTLANHDPAELLVLAIDEHGLSPLMRKHLQDFAATGLSPGFIPSPQSDQNTDNTP
ncbi:MAG: transposase family protein [Granulosicoccus sp.]|nr:transposase family protein [Granulosicoccus sp.]